MQCDRTSKALNDIDLVSAKAENCCVVDRASTLMGLVRKEICGHCVYCREGTAQLQAIILEISNGKGKPDDLDLILEICSTIRDMADCELSKTACANLAEAVENFRDEWDAHIRRKKCPAAVCRRLVTYHISGEKCNGCGECFGKCPEGAITGDKDMIHVINQDQCMNCGICFDICSKLQNAVLKAGTVKPRTPEKPIPVGTWQDKPAGLGGLNRGLGLKKQN